MTYSKKKLYLILKGYSDNYAYRKKRIVYLLGEITIFFFFKNRNNNDNNWFKNKINNDKKDSKSQTVFNDGVKAKYRES